MLKMLFCLLCLLVLSSETGIFSVIFFGAGRLHHNDGFQN